MQVFVQTNKTYTLEIDPNDKLQRLKAKIQDRTGISSKNQRLMFEGKQLKGNALLTQYKITNYCIIHVMPSLSTKTRTSITLNINLSDIVQFIPKQKTTWIINCDETTTIDSILKELEISYLSESLRMDFYDDVLVTASYIYSQMVDKPLFNISNIINRHTNTIELSFHFISNQISQRIINTQFIKKMTKYFENNEPETRNSFAMNAILQIINTMSSLKSNNKLLHESALCFAKFCEGGISRTVKKETIEEQIIPQILKIFQYKNDGYMSEIRPLLRNGLVNICTKVKHTSVLTIVLDQLIDLVDPCNDKHCLLAVSKFYVDMCSRAARLNNASFNKIIRHLNILIFYEDDTNILYNALRTYSVFISNRRYRNFLNIQKPISDEDAKLIVKKYNKKQNQNRLIFNGFIYETVKGANMEYIPSDIALVMFKFYDCYENINTNILAKLMEFMDKNNGHWHVIKSSVWNIAKKLIPPLSILSDKFSSYCSQLHKDIKKTNFYTIISYYGLIDGLVFIMNDIMIPFFEIIGNETDECMVCLNVKKGRIYELCTSVEFYCCECLKHITLYKDNDGLMKEILDIIEYLFNNDDVQSIVVQKLTDEKCIKVLKKIQNIGLKCIAESQLFRIGLLLDISPFHCTV